jgi:hypothetical protein
VTADEYVRALREEFPTLRVIRKEDDAFSRLLDRLLRIVTLGRQSSFMTRYVTTIGWTVYVPRDWDARADADRYITLRHEAVHLRQFRRYGRLGMSVLYLLPILPMGLALGRARLVWEAYAETLRATAEVRGPAAAEDPALHDRIVQQFTSGAYGWMWPFPSTIRRWIGGVIEEIRMERNAPSV